jgi:hypothetical protein
MACARPHSYFKAAVPPHAGLRHQGPSTHALPTKLAGSLPHVQQQLPGKLLSCH